MSLISTLFALLSVSFMPSRKPDDVRITELEAEVDALKRQLEEARTALSEAHADIGRWQDVALSWHRRYEKAIQPVLDREIAAEIANQARHQVLMNQAMAQHAQAQMSAHQAMQSNLGFAYQSGIGQQNAYAFCNCVPGRHDLFIGGHSA